VEARRCLTGDGRADPVLSASANPVDVGAADPAPSVRRNGADGAPPAPGRDLADTPPGRNLADTPLS